ncbi:MAG: tRNA (N(6)-L-threonylcarbamoyladenosine(37)-C(2))-methylthiotransferase MtaB [Eubacterium sp.]|nr:tRNA (N(6)-L-threonylcarbamoyladenosine(37)-C(2))-methylthiotransferase MtaB [Eubacterium sp.]
MKKQTAALHNLGCKVNAYELEAVRQLLEGSGYEIVPFAPGADLYVINTCTVTSIADKKSRQMLHRAKKMNPDALVVAMGCYAQINGDSLTKDPAIDIVIGNNKRMELLQAIQAHQESGEKQDARININQTKIYEPLEITRSSEHTRAFIKVQDGCNQFCTYCMIPYARGRVRSRRPEDVVREVTKLAENGTREVVITGIHVCSYGQDFEAGGLSASAADSGLRTDGQKTDLLYLLQQVNKIPGIDRIRLGSLEPTVMTEETAAGMARLEKLCPHFHLSLQSGCDATLARMNRGYTAAEYRGIVELLRREFDRPSITTDVIVGFPGETAEEFEESRKFIDDISFYETHIFPYSRRAGTRAAAFPDQIPETVKKERALILRELGDAKRAAWLQQYTGETAEVLPEEKIQVKGKWYWRGHTPRYQEALLPADGGSADPAVFRNADPAGSGSAGPAASGNIGASAAGSTLIAAGVPVQVKILDVLEKQYLLCEKHEIF